MAKETLETLFTQKDSSFQAATAVLPNKYEFLLNGSACCAVARVVRAQQNSKKKIGNKSERNSSLDEKLLVCTNFTCTKKKLFAWFLWAFRRNCQEERIVLINPMSIKPHLGTLFSVWYTFNWLQISSITNLDGQWSVSSIPNSTCTWLADFPTSHNELIVPHSNVYFTISFVYHTQPRYFPWFHTDSPKTK